MHVKTQLHLGSAKKEKAFHPTTTSISSSHYHRLPSVQLSLHSKIKTSFLEEAGSISQKFLL